MRVPSLPPSDQDFLGFQARSLNPCTPVKPRSAGASLACSSWRPRLPLITHDSRLPFRPLCFSSV